MPMEVIQYQLYSNEELIQLSKEGIAKQVQMDLDGPASNSYIMLLIELA